MSYLQQVFRTAPKEPSEYAGAAVLILDKDQSVTALNITNRDGLVMCGKRLSVAKDGETVTNEKGEVFHIHKGTASANISDGDYYDIWGGDILRSLGCMTHSAPQFELLTVGEPDSETTICSPKGYAIILDFGRVVRSTFWITGGFDPTDLRSIDRFLSKVKVEMGKIGLTPGISAVVDIEDYTHVGRNRIRYTGKSVLSTIPQLEPVSGIWIMGENEDAVNVYQEPK